MATEITLDKSKILNITAVKGYTFGPLLLRFSVTGSDPKEYYDMSNWTFEMKVKISSYQENSSFEFTDFISNSNGELLITKSASEMNLIQPIQYSYELRATLPNGESYRLLNGYLNILDAIND